MLGHNMLDLDGDDSSNDDDDDDGGLLDKIGDKWDDVKDDIEGEINDLTGNIADELADTLGISEWYSLHVMDACEGSYKPNATSPGAGLNVTNCTDSDPNCTYLAECELCLILTIVRPLQLDRDSQPRT